MLKQAKHFPVTKNPMLPAGTYDGKQILVTGGGTGLGKAMAKRFAELGGEVAICSRKIPVLEKTANEINESLGKEAISFKQLDVRDTKMVQDFFADYLPDVIVNNAAGNFISPTERLTQSAFHNIIDIVLKGTASITLEAGKKMIKENKGGVFMSVGVPYASTGSAYVVPSACAKSGVEALTKSLSAEWGQYGIRLNCVSLGPIYTEGAFSRLDPTNEGQKYMVSQTPCGRLGEPEEFANLATYVCSDYASWMSGEIVTFDGGNNRQLSGMFDSVRRIPNEMWDQLAEQIKKSKSS